jgi:hypothetical protein
MRLIYEVKGTLHAGGLHGEEYLFEDALCSPKQFALGGLHENFDGNHNDYDFCKRRVFFRGCAL